MYSCCYTFITLHEKRGCIFPNMGAWLHRIIFLLSGLGSGVWLVNSGRRRANPINPSSPEPNSLLSNAFESVHFLFLFNLIQKNIGAIDRPLAGTYPGVLRQYSLLTCFATMRASAWSAPIQNRINWS